MFATCFGANCGASSMITRPAGSSRYSVCCGSSARQSDAVDWEMTSAGVRGFASPSISVAAASSALRNAIPVTNRSSPTRASGPRDLQCKLPAGSAARAEGFTVRFGKLRLRAILALLVLTTSVPLGLFAGILIVRSSHEQRALVEQRNVETARAVAVAVDQHVESARAALQALAATDLL